MGTFPKWAFSKKKQTHLSLCINFRQYPTSSRVMFKYTRFLFHTMTRLHSSRMRTARSLTVSPSMHCTGGFCSWGGVSAPGGVVSQHALRQTPPLWTEFLTHTSENITLPQTSFAGGKNISNTVRNLLWNNYALYVNNLVSTDCLIKRQIDTLIDQLIQLLIFTHHSVHGRWTNGSWFYTVLMTHPL